MKYCTDILYWASEGFFQDCDLCTCQIYWNTTLLTIYISWLYLIADQLRVCVVQMYSACLQSWHYVLLLTDSLEIHAAAAAGIMFCQIQQLCSLTSMNWLQSCSFYGQPLFCLGVGLSQPQEMMNNMLVVSMHISAPTYSHFETSSRKLHKSFLIYSIKPARLIWCFLYISLLLQTISLRFSQLRIVWDFLFSISGAQMVFFCWPEIFYCKLGFKKWRNK